MAESSPLRRRMIEDMTVRNLSPATQRSYIHAVAKFSRYFGHSPDRLGLEEVRAFQVQLVAQGISWPAPNQTVCALRFFYGVTLGLDTIPERIRYAREPHKLPVVLNADEVVRFLEAAPSLKTGAALTTAYAAGLRASEAVSLKVADIDSGRMVIRIEQGKGGQDRTVMLSAQRLGILRTYWRLARPKHWLFPGRDESKPLDVQVLTRGLPIRSCRGRLGQAGHGAHAAAQLRHASPGERYGYPHYSGPAGARQSVEHGALHASLEQAHPADGKPARSADIGDRTARPIQRRHVGGSGSGGCLPPPRRRLSPRTRRTPWPHRGGSFAPFARLALIAA